MRAAGDFSPGPPQPVMAAARQATSTEQAAAAAAARAWGRAEEDAVALGTGCFDDREAVQLALKDARGSIDQAWEARAAL